MTGSGTLIMETQKLSHLFSIQLIMLRKSLIFSNSSAVANHVPPQVDKSLEEKGKDVQMINQASKKEADRQTVKDLVKMSNRCIFTISTQFPWDIFPNKIDIEEDRVTFTFRQFLAWQSHSVDIKDISNVFIESSLFSSSLQVVTHTYIENEIKIGHLNRKGAEKARRIIEGLRTFAEHNINTSNYGINELIAKIEEFHTKQTIS